MNRRAQASQTNSKQTGKQLKASDCTSTGKTGMQISPDTLIPIQNSSANAINSISRCSSISALTPRQTVNRSSAKDSDSSSGTSKKATFSFSTPQPVLSARPSFPRMKAISGTGLNPWKSRPMSEASPTIRATSESKSSARLKLSQKRKKQKTQCADSSAHATKES